MKKKDLRVGMIVEDRSDYSQNCTKRPYKLILNINLKVGCYYYLTSESPNRFWVTTAIDPDGGMYRDSFHRIMDLKLVR